MWHKRSASCFVPSMLDNDPCCLFDRLCIDWCVHHNGFAVLFFWLFTWTLADIYLYLVVRSITVLVVAYTLYRTFFADAHQRKRYYFTVLAVAIVLPFLFLCLVALVRFTFFSFFYM